MNILLSTQSWISFSAQSIQTHIENSFLFKHKKITAIVALILTSLVTCYLIYHHYLLKGKKVVVLGDNQQILESKLSDFLSVQEANFQRFSSSLMALQNIIEQYKQIQKEWNDLTDYTEEELDQLLDNLNLNLGRKEFNNTEALYLDLKTQLQLNHQRFKGACENQQSFQDLQKQFDVKEQEFQLLKSQMESHQKQQKNLIQNVRDQKQKFIDVKYQREKQVIQDRKTQVEQNIIENVVKGLQQQEQDFSDSLVNLTQVINEYALRSPQPLNLFATKEALDNLCQTLQQDIIVTKKYVHEIELKKIKINTNLDIYQNQHHQNLQNLKNRLKLKIDEFEQLKIKASLQEKQQNDLLERLFERKKEIIGQEYMQSMRKHDQDRQQLLQKTKEDLDAMARQSKEEYAELAKRYKWEPE